MTKDLWTETFGAPPRTARRATAAWSRRWERPRVVLWTSWPRRTRAARPTVRLVAMRPRPRVPPAVPARVARWTTTPALATLARRSGRPASARWLRSSLPLRVLSNSVLGYLARAGYYGTDADLASHRSRESYPLARESS